MGKVIFSIQYEIDPVKRSEFLAVAKELKSLVVAEGLESYSVYEAKPNHFEEIYIFVQKKRTKILTIAKMRESIF